VLLREGVAKFDHLLELPRRVDVEQRKRELAAVEGLNNPVNSLNTLLGYNASMRNPDLISQQLQSDFPGFENGTDFEKITGARKLNSTEYYFHKQLGYITLSRKLQNDEALVVSYEYTYNGQSSSARSKIK
jgi:cell surface protein SprA